MINKFLTTNVFLRYFHEEQTGEESNIVFLPISDLQEVGIPIHPGTGDDLENDGCLYKFDIVAQHFVQLVG